MRRQQLVGGAVILALIVLVGVGLWQTAPERAGPRPAVVRHPQRVMGTTCDLVAVGQRADAALREAEAELRAVEARMSIRLEDSEISHLNAATAGEEVPLSPETLEVLQAAREAAAHTGGAFDITCEPLIELWRRAGETGRLPAQADLDEARAASTWELIDLTDRGAIKHSADARVDLGGIAKGYAIDRAVEALRGAGLAGGLVDVGGDMKCFGEPPEGDCWKVEVKNPFGPGSLCQLRVRAGAICTSGNYARFTVIEGKRCSHIIDPRSGRPAYAIPSVTVAAPKALTADIWATALSVLGPDGLQQMPGRVEALMILGSADSYRLLCTPGFQELLPRPLPERLTVVEAWDRE